MNGDKKWKVEFFGEGTSWRAENSFVKKFVKDYGSVQTDSFFDYKFSMNIRRYNTLKNETEHLKELIESI